MTHLAEERFDKIVENFLRLKKDPRGFPGVDNRQYDEILLFYVITEP